MADITIFQAKTNTTILMLTNDEERMAGECTMFTEIKIQQELERFNANRNICISHHKYLQNTNSFVVVVGGHTGQDLSTIINTYNPKVVILEPIAIFADSLRKKFESNSRVTVLNFGLGKRNELAKIDNTNNITSENGGNKLTVEMKDATEFFRSIRVGKFYIDLLILDCDGCELGVLENIIESELVKNFKNVQIYFAHAQNGNAKVRYCEIQPLLSRTHRVTLQYKYFLENWRRKDIP